MSKLSVDRILTLLPHRYPFILVDRVESCTTGQCIHAIKNVSANEPQFMGHFPDRPLMPGVLMIESMAQAAGLLMLLSDENEALSDPALYVLAGVDRVRFKRMVVPGDQLNLHLTLEKARQGIAWFVGYIQVDDQKVCTASLLLAQTT